MSVVRHVAYVVYVLQNILTSYTNEIQLTTDLPQPPAGGGILPYWLLITSVASIYNVAQNYVTLKQSKEIYSGKEDQSELHVSLISPGLRKKIQGGTLPCLQSVDNSDAPRRPSLRRLDRDGCRDPPACRLRHLQQGSVRPRHRCVRRRNLPLRLRVARLWHRQAEPRLHRTSRHWL